MIRLAEQTTEKVRAVRTGVGYLPLPDWGVIELSGPDAAMFLNNQTSNDVKGLAGGEGQINALLDRKAHVRALFSVHRLADNYWLLMETNQVPHVLAALELMHFSEKAIFEDQSPRWSLFSIHGPESDSVLKQDAGGILLTTLPENSIRMLPDCFGVQAMVIKKTMTGEEGFVIAVPTEQAVRFEQELKHAGKALNLIQLDTDSLEILRVEAGIVRFGIDVDESVMLPETGLERVAVSYTKGCFPGQEVVAKIRTHGSAPRGLVGLVLDPSVTPPGPGKELVLGDKVIGTTRSAVSSPTLNKTLVMAYLGRDFRIPGKTLSVSLQGRPVEAKVQFLPFYTALSASEKARLAYDAALKAFAEDREKEAITLLREAIEWNPHLADAYESLGVILSRREQYEEAIALMQQLAELEPDLVMAHTNLSVFYMKMGMKEEAEVEKAKATTLEFKQAMAKAQQQRSEVEEAQQKRQQLQEKIEMFQQVLALDAEDVLATYGLGNTLVELDRYDEAIPLLDKVLTLDPKYTVAYLALGKAYAENHQPEQARDVFQRGVEVASQRGDFMPLQEMQRRLAQLESPE